MTEKDEYSQEVDSDAPLTFSEIARFIGRILLFLTVSGIGAGIILSFLRG